MKASSITIKWRIYSAMEWIKANLRVFLRSSLCFWIVIIIISFNVCTFSLKFYPQEKWMIEILGIIIIHK